MRKVNSDTATHVLADACRVLASVGAGERSLDDALDSALDYPELRRTTGSLLFFYFRRKRFVDKWIDTLACRPPRPRLRRLLAAVLTQIRFQSGIVPESAANVAVELAKSAGNANEAKFVNAVLRRAVRELPPVDDAPEEVLPPAVLKRWRGRYSPEELAAMCRAFLSPAPFTFRAERGFEPPPEWEGTAVPCRGPFRFFESPKPGLVLDSEAMREGRIYIQDPATTLATSLPGMEPVRRILDVCAAPGGKSLLLSERMKAGTSLVAADRSARRQEQTKENFRRRGLDFAVITAEPRELAGEFDLVLADVPCSNTGVFRRRPDALWRFGAAELRKITVLQHSILDAAAARVAPGGQLVYSTCSIEPEENEQQAERFLAEHPDFTRMASEQLLPSVESDGAYACLLRRSAQSMPT